MENRSFCIVSLRLACLEEKQTFWRELARLAAPAFPPASRTDGDIIDRSDQFSCFDVSFVFQILLAFSVGLSLGWLAGRFQGVRVKCSRVSFFCGFPPSSFTLLPRWRKSFPCGGGRRIIIFRARHFLSVRQFPRWKNHSLTFSLKSAPSSSFSSSSSFRTLLYLPGLHSLVFCRRRRHRCNYNVQSQLANACDDVRCCCCCSSGLKKNHF
jgi:hypothetical protein